MYGDLVSYQGSIDRRSYKTGHGLH
jgi:hypothetical protein